MTFEGTIHDTGATVPFNSSDVEQAFWESILSLTLS